MAIADEGYVSRLLATITGRRSGSAVSADGDLIRLVTNGTGRSSGATSIDGAAVRIGSAAISKEGAARTAKNIGRDLLSFGGSPVGILANYLAGAFGGEDSEGSMKPERFQAPERINYELGVARGEYVPVDSSESAAVREMRAASSNPQGNVLIQVQAMDSRSFLDHSNEIAEAVRKALLDSHPLRDVLSE